MLFITGMPGAGKTYWGRRVAAALNLPFTDLDEYIAQHEQCSIADIFARQGEDYFREKEAEYLLQLIQTQPHNSIIACGGGTPCCHHNMATMNQAGTTVYLQATIPVLLHNLQNSATKRPLLAGYADPTARLQQLLAQRAPYYEQAHHILHTENISITTFEQIIN